MVATTPSGNTSVYGGVITTATLSAAGNITGSYYFGNGSQLTGVVAGLSGNLTGNINGQGYSISNIAVLSATGNIAGNILTVPFGTSQTPTNIQRIILAQALIA